MHGSRGHETTSHAGACDVAGFTLAEAWALLRGLAARAQGGSPLVTATVFTRGQGAAGSWNERPYAAGEEAHQAPGVRSVPGSAEQLCIDPHAASVVGVPAGEARTLLELMLPLVVGLRAGSLVLGHLGQSLDGRVATPSGASKFITGHEDLVHTHRLRALFDAVLVGVRTVQLDDPQLTTRHVSGPHPTRVVLDPQGKLRAGFKLLEDGEAPTLIVSALEHTTAPRRAGSVEWVGMPCREGRFSLGQLRRLLAERGLSRLFVEGGGVTVSRFLAARVLDRLHVSVAPLILGSGAPAFKLPEIDKLEEALSLRCRHFALGRDVLFDCELTPLSEPEAE